MFGLGANELILILLFGFIIFGPDKLPAMAKTIGQAIKKFRTAQDEMTNVIRNEVYDPNSDDPFKNPLDAISKLEESAKREDNAESFSDRKARYDRQREAKKAAEERRANASAKKSSKADAASAEKHAEGAPALEAAAAAGAKAAEAAKAADAVVEPEATGADSAVAAAAADDAGAAVEPVEPAKPASGKKLTADELYGTKPRAKKPAAKSAPAPAKEGGPASEPIDKKVTEAADDADEEGEE